MAFPTSHLGLENVLRDVHDPVTQTLRTTATATVSGGVVEILMSHIDDSVRIGDGTLLTTVTAVGPKNGLDVNVISPINVALSTVGTLENFYNEIIGVASGVTVTIASYTVPGGVTAYLPRIMASGTNMSEYEILINGSVISKKRTYIGGELNLDFEFSSPDAWGYPLVAGDLVQVKGNHARPSLGNFNANIMVIEV